MQLYINYYIKIYKVFLMISYDEISPHHILFIKYIYIEILSKYTDGTYL